MCFHVSLVLDWHPIPVALVALVDAVSVVVPQDGRPVRVDELKRVLDSQVMNFAFWNAGYADFDETTVTKLEAWVVFQIHAFSSTYIVLRATCSTTGSGRIIVWVGAKHRETVVNRSHPSENDI